MVRRRPPRGLRPDELELWRQVARSAKPLHPIPAPVDLPRILPPEQPAPPSPLTDLSGLRIGVKAPVKPSPFDPAPTLPERLHQQPLGMDAREFARIKRGKRRPEGKLDLHGMTLEEAHPRLTSFILGAHAAGKRLVLVITGKGRLRDELAPMPVRHGILKHQVPRWLTTGPLAGRVQQVMEAHQRHGGSGAYYVYLRRWGK